MLIKDKEITAAKPFLRKDGRWCCELRLGINDSTGKLLKKVFMDYLNN